MLLKGFEQFPVTNLPVADEPEQDKAGQESQHKRERDEVIQQAPMTGNQITHRITMALFSLIVS